MCWFRRPPRAGILGLSRTDGPAHAPAGRARRGLLPGPVTRYRISSADLGSELVAALPLHHRVALGEELRFAVFPVLDRDRVDIRDAYAATAVVVDLVFDDGSRLSAAGARDQYGVPLDARTRFDAKTIAVDQWTLTRVALDAVAGRTVTRAELRVAVVGGSDGITRVDGYLDALAIGPVPAPPVDLVDRVRTTRGSHSNGGFSRGNTAPIVAMPHGGVFGIPVTDASTRRWPYKWADTELQAFATSHIPSPWVQDRGVFQFFPSVEPLAFSHAEESDRPHRYAVRLAGGIEAELTAGRMSLVARFRYPGSTGVMTFGQLDGNGALAIDGSAVTAHVDGAGDLPRMFVHVELDRPVLRSRVRGTRGRATLDLGAEREVTLRLATSFLSPEQARRNLELDGALDDFETVAARAHDAWAERLAPFEIEGGSDDQLSSVYSSLYRLFLYPNVAGENTVTAEAPVWRYASPFVRGRVVDGELSVTNGFWDTYRTVWPLLTLLRPDDTGRLLDGFLQHYRESGWTSRWSAPGPVDSMTGTTTDVIFADAVAARLPHLDALTAYNSALHNATVPSDDPHVGRKGIRAQSFRGFTDTSVGEGMSWSLDSALTDTSICAFARTLLARLPAGDPRRESLEAEAEYFAARGARWAQVFDARIGFFQGRHPDGSRRSDPADYDPRDWGGDYTETNGWGTAFTAPHDGAGLAGAYGGPAALEAKLDAFFAEPETGRAAFRGHYRTVIHEMEEARDVRIGMLGLSNQPAHHIPFMYAFTGAHAKTQAVVREAVRRLFLGSDLGQGYPGDEDNGEMSGWYLFAVLGLYPLVPGTGEFVITTPLFERLSVRLGSGATLIVRTTGDLAHDYIAGVTLDGRPWDRITIPRERLLRGAELVITRSATPTRWAADSTPGSLTTPGELPRMRLDLTHPADAADAGWATSGPAHTAFDDAGNHAVPLAPEEELGWRFPAPTRSGLYTVTLEAAGVARWRLEGETESGWVPLDERTETFAWEGQTRPFRIAHPGAHSAYRIVAASELRVLQWELLGDS